jgi:hypothetical protein
VTELGPAGLHAGVPAALGAACRPARPACCMPDSLPARPACCMPDSLPARPACCMPDSLPACRADRIIPHASPIEGTVGAKSLKVPSIGERFDRDPRSGITVHTADPCSRRGSPTRVHDAGLSWWARRVERGSRVRRAERGSRVRRAERGSRVRRAERGSRVCQVSSSARVRGPSSTTPASARAARAVSCSSVSTSRRRPECSRTASST